MRCRSTHQTKKDDKASIIFETGSLEQLVEVIGNLRLRVILKSKNPEAFIVTRLCDVLPDGRSTRIPMVTHQLSSNGGIVEHKSLAPNKIYEIELELDGVTHLFAKGHPICLALSNTYWPML